MPYDGTRLYVNKIKVKSHNARKTSFLLYNIETLGDYTVKIWNSLVIFSNKHTCDKYNHFEYT